METLGGIILGALLSWGWFTFQKSLDKRSEHFNALIAIKYAMSENLDTSHTIMTGLKQFKSALVKKNLFYPSFKEFNLPKSIIFGLQNARFIKDMFGICLEMERANRDIADTSGRYNKILDRFLEDGGNKNTNALSAYRRNADIVMKDLSRLLSFIGRLDEKLINITAKSWVLAKYHPRWIDKIVNLFKQTDSYPFVLHDDMETAYHQIKTERMRRMINYADKE